MGRVPRDALPHALRLDEPKGGETGRVQAASAHMVTSQDIEWLQNGQSNCVASLAPFFLAGALRFDFLRPILAAFAGGRGGDVGQVARRAQWCGGRAR